MVLKCCRHPEEEATAGSVQNSLGREAFSIRAFLPILHICCWCTGGLWVSISSGPVRWPLQWLGSEITKGSSAGFSFHHIIWLYCHLQDCLSLSVTHGWDHSETAEDNLYHDCIWDGSWGSRHIQGEWKNIDESFDKSFSHSIQIAEHVGTEVNMPCMAQRQQHCSNPQVSSPKDYYKTTVPIPFLDHVLFTLDSVFGSFQGCFKFFWCCPISLLFARRQSGCCYGEVRSRSPICWAIYWWAEKMDKAVGTHTEITRLSQPWHNLVQSCQFLVITLQPCHNHVEKLSIPCHNPTTKAG